MFLPFVQAGADKSGVGLGLPIGQRSVAANGGVLKYSGQTVRVEGEELLLMCEDDIKGDVE